VCRPPLTNFLSCPRMFFLAALLVSFPWGFCLSVPYARPFFPYLFASPGSLCSMPEKGVDVLFVYFFLFFFLVTPNRSPFNDSFILQETHPFFFSRCFVGSLNMFGSVEPLQLSSTGVSAAVAPTAGHSGKIFFDIFVSFYRRFFFVHFPLTFGFTFFSGTFLLFSVREPVTHRIFAPFFYPSGPFFF